ncbi:hypothetical protein D3C76_1454850 [compost metagenome]
MGLHISDGLDRLQGKSLGLFIISNRSGNSPPDILLEAVLPACKPRRFLGKGASLQGIPKIVVELADAGQPGCIGLVRPPFGSKLRRHNPALTQQHKGRI